MDLVKQRKSALLLYSRLLMQQFISLSVHLGGFSSWMILGSLAAFSCWILLLSSLSGFSLWILLLDPLTGSSDWIHWLDPLTRYPCWVLWLDSIQWIFSVDSCSSFGTSSRQWTVCSSDRLYSVVFRCIQFYSVVFSLISTLSSFTAFDQWTVDGDEF